MFVFYFYECQIPILYLNQREIFGGTSCCIRLIVNSLRTTVGKGAANPCILIPLFPLLRNWDSATASERAGLTCGWAGTQEGLSYKYTPWVMGHKANASKIRYFLLWVPGPALVSATLAKHQGG